MGQAGEFLIFIPLGLLSGVVFNAFGILKTITKNNLIVVIISDIASCLVSGIIFILGIFNYEMGRFALFEMVAFVIGIILEQIFIKNLFARPILFVYNKLKLRKKN